MSTPRLCLLALALCSAFTIASAQSTGEKWRITNSMQMQGMSMPGRTSEICKTGGSDEPPMQTDKNCQVYDNKRSGNTQTFKMRCTGKEAMEGTVELTYLAPDHYKGKMDVSAQGQQMTMNYEGQKLGACDGNETNTKAKQMIEKSQQQTAQFAKQQCSEAAKAASLPSLMANCKDPQDIKTYCANFQTYKNFAAQEEMQRQYSGQPSIASVSTTPLDDSAKLCGTTAEAVRNTLCSTAESKDELDFLAKECTTQATELAKAQCAGRRYTAVAAKYRGFCSNFSSMMDKGEASSSSSSGASDAGKGLFNRGKKALGGLL